MFKNIKDSTSPVITAKAHINSCHKTAEKLNLPDTAVLFFMNGGVEYLLENYS